jgi:hypothetical protein
MRWYDTPFCIFFADIMAAGLVSGDIIFLLFGLVCYIVYERSVLIFRDIE